MDVIGFLLGLFFCAFVAATILPMQSEAVLIGLLLKTDITPWILVAVATAGNVLGACVNWALGRYLESFKDKRWFPASADDLQKAQIFYAKYGRWSLLLSWVPIIGDPLTIVAGVMREKFAVFLLLVFFAKAGRYIALTALTLGLV